MAEVIQGAIEGFTREINGCAIDRAAKLSQNVLDRKWQIKKLAKTTGDTGFEDLTGHDRLQSNWHSSTLALSIRASGLTAAIRQQLWSASVKAAGDWG
jgi:hypothetical protein